MNRFTCLVKSKPVKQGSAIQWYFPLWKSQYSLAQLCHNNPIMHHSLKSSIWALPVRWKNEPRKNKNSKIIVIPLKNISILWKKMKAYIGPIVQNLTILLHKLFLLFCNFINTTAYHFGGQCVPSSKDKALIVMLYPYLSYFAMTSFKDNFLI